MAVVLSRYMKDWQNKVEQVPGFTPARFNKQLGRTLTAYKSKQQTQNTEVFNPSSPSPLRIMFEENVWSNRKFLHFVPWKVEEVPCTIQKMLVS
jgi:hypothetical protein